MKQDRLAIEHTIEECIQNNVFTDYFIEHKEKVIDMYEFKFEVQRALQLIIQKSNNVSLTEIALELKQQGYRIDTISEVTRLTEEEINKL